MQYSYFYRYFLKLLKVTPVRGHTPKDAVSGIDLKGLKFESSTLTCSILISLRESSKPFFVPKFTKNGLNMFMHFRD